MDIITQLKKQIKTDEFDFLTLKYALSDYKQPRMKINWLLKNKIIVRGKKGLYIFAREYARGLISKEHLANLIYGPSYISLEYALAYHGLIPERVETLTSTTLKRDKAFTSPLGPFNYRYLHPQKYPLGITMRAIDEARFVLIATPEKALADIVYFSTSLDISSAEDAEHYLLSDLRLDLEILKSFDTELFTQLAALYKNSNLSELAKYLEKICE